MFFSRQPFMKREWLDYSNQARSSLTSSTLFDPGHRAAVLVCVLIYFLFGFPYALLMFAFCFGTYEVFEDDTIQEYMSYATPIQDKSIWNFEMWLKYYRIKYGDREFRRRFHL